MNKNDFHAENPLGEKVEKIGKKNIPRYTCMHTCTDRYERAVDSSSFVSVFVYDYIPLSIFTEKFSETFLCLTEFLSGESQRWPYHRCDSLVFATQRIHIR